MSLPALLLNLFLATAGAGEPVPFSSERWIFHGAEHRVEDHLGREALYLQGGYAELDVGGFLDGTIEFDLAVTGERGFMGGFWRRLGQGEYEQFYIRPHQSGNPDANQYTPVFHGLAAWQLYHGPGYGQPVDFPLNAWISIRIEVAGDRADIYVGDADEPTVAARLKRMPLPGTIGVLNPGNYTGTHFSNFRYSRTRPRLAGEPPQREAAEAGTVLAWQVSTPIPEDSLGTTLDETRLDQLEWQWLDAEAGGITNLARLHAPGPERDTVLARLEIESKSDGLRRIDFGYSDRLRIYHEGRAIYAGDNGYRSRDYRYLGTMGWFDAIYVPLEAGLNTLIFAVSEDFGGWGLQARLAEPEGLLLQSGRHD